MASSNPKSVRSPSPTGSVRSAAQAGVGASAYNDKKDGLKVEYFYGDRAKLGMFLVQLQAVFALRPTDFNTHPSRVLYAAMHMRGSAFHWIEPLMKDYLTYASGQWEDETREIFGKYDNFTERITQIFGTPGEEQQAAQRIHSLKQTGSAAQYFALFQRLKAKLNWEDNAYTAAFYQGLKDQIKDEIGMKPPKKFKDLVDKAIEVDNWLYERRLDKKGYKGKIGGSYYKSKNYSSYGDPMDLDAMERGRSSRPNKGKFPRQGLSNKERERRKKDNLCYSCGKSGHMARECGNGPKGLHMMEKVTAGIEGKKADTSIEKELEQLKALIRGLQLRHIQLYAEAREVGKGIQQAQKKASIAEKAQKGPQPVQEEGTTSREAQYPNQVSTALTTATEDVDVFTEALEWEKKGGFDHSMMTWTLCCDDSCAIHLKEKEKARWFPHGKKARRQLDLCGLDDNESTKDLAVMERETFIWEKYDVEMVGTSVAVVRTKHWINTPCDGLCNSTPGGSCESQHRKFNPHGNPENRDELIMLTRCDISCDNSAPHTHDIIGLDDYEFSFIREDNDDNTEWEESY